MLNVKSSRINGPESKLLTTTLNCLFCPIFVFFVWMAFRWKGHKTEIISSHFFALISAITQSSKASEEGKCKTSQCQLLALSLRPTIACETAANLACTFHTKRIIPATCVSFSGALSSLSPARHKCQHTNLIIYERKIVCLQTHFSSSRRKSFNLFPIQKILHDEKKNRYLACCCALREFLLVGFSCFPLFPTHNRHSASAPVSSTI